MLKYQCDGCGREIPESALRYTVTIDVRAAYDEIEVRLADLIRDHRREILDLLEQLRHCNAGELEEQVYKKIKLDLCPTCQKAFIAAPLQFSPGQPARDMEIDVDRFLRSLGFGETPNEEPE